MFRLIHVFVACAVLAAVLPGGLAEGGTIHVDPKDPAAADANPGTPGRPLKTIGRAAAVVRPGDTVLVHEGVYRETVALERSGTEAAPIRFMAQPGEVVVVSGAEPVEGPWSVDAGSIYKTRVGGPVRQVFVDGKAMIEARWPNRPLGRLWDRSDWAEAGAGSRYGKMVDRKLAATGIDFTGAIAVLNVAHQFYTWTRPVLRHAPGSDHFEYAKDLTGITHFADKTKPWEDDRYYLFGKLEALDAPGEWYHDAETETLYLWAPEGDQPAGHAVERKARDYGFTGRGLAYVEICGFHLFGCAFSLLEADHVSVEGCHVLYPSGARRLAEKGFREDGVVCRISGRFNKVRHSSFAYGSTDGLKVQGSGNLVENNLVHDFCWNGSLKFVGLSLGGVATEDKSVRNVARYNTLFNLGNAVINYRGPGQTIEYNHVYDGGLACKDVALVYTGQPSTAGNVVRYNWVHGCYTERVQPSGLHGGLGIRGDDQTRRLTVDHNVVWNCGRDGIIVKGDFNRVVNNTVFDIGSQQRPGNDIDLPTAKEPEKWWRRQFPLLPVQNAHSLAANNAAAMITGDTRGTPYKFEENLVANYQGKDLALVDPGHFDFRPRDDSPLVDAGKVIAGFPGGYAGGAPDVGAYEHGKPRWVPGYRNAVWVLPGPADGRRRPVRVLLAMPPLEPVTVYVAGSSGATQVSPAELTFTPEDWMRPKVLVVRGTAPALRFAVERFDLDRTIELATVDPAAGLELGFRTVP